MFSLRVSSGSVFRIFGFHFFFLLLGKPDRSSGVQRKALVAHNHYATARLSLAGGASSAKIVAPGCEQS